METCQALPLAAAAPPLSCDVIDAAIDGGAGAEQRSDDELLTPPPCIEARASLLSNGDDELFDSGSQDCAGVDVGPSEQSLDMADPCVGDGDDAAPAEAAEAETVTAAVAESEAPAEAAATEAEAAETGTEATEAEVSEAESATEAVEAATEPDVPEGTEEVEPLVAESAAVVEAEPEAASEGAAEATAEPVAELEPQLATEAASAEESAEVAAAEGTSPRSCMRRCRPARRRSDSAADKHPISALRRGSEAPPPPPRRVHFSDTPVTALIPAADPRRLLGCGDVVAAYRAACERHGSEPLAEVLTQLTEPAGDALRLSGLPLTLADVDSLEDALRRRRWRRVDAADCSLRGETLAALLQIVTHYDVTPWLSLAGAASERLGWTAVCGAVRDAGRRSGLQWLALDRISLGEVAAAALGRSLRESRLRVLHLERCHLHGRPLLTLLAAGLRSAAGLRQLYLGGNELGSGDGSLLGAALRQNTSLQLLDLRNNAFDDDAAGYLLAGLAEQQPRAPHTGLLTLNLWHNRLTSESAGSIAALLAAHPALETLNLGFNALGDAVAARIAEPLSRCGPLRRLGLQACLLSDAAAVALGGAVAAGSGLVRLDLRGNRMSATGLRALLASVEVNPAMRRLDVDPETAETTEYATAPPVRAQKAERTVVEEEEEESSPDGEERGSPERADSGIDSPAKFSSGGAGVESGDSVDGGVGSLEAEMEAEGAGLGSSIDSTLGSSADSNAPQFAASGRCDSTADGRSAGGDSDSTDSAPSGDSEYGALQAALAAACEENRRRPAPESATCTPSPPPAEAEDEPSAGHWLRRKLSAALRRVSLTCETPPRLPTASPAACDVPAAATTTSTSSSGGGGSPTAAQPVPVPDRSRNRRLVSPSPSPSESPLPSPTSGRSRFRVFRVSSVEPPPGTPPLMRGLPRTLLTECEQASAPSFLRDGSPGPTAVEDEEPPPVRKDSLAVLRERSVRLGSRGVTGSCAAECAEGVGADSLGSVCELDGDQWTDELRLGTSPAPVNGYLNAPQCSSSWGAAAASPGLSPAPSPGTSPGVGRCPESAAAACEGGGEPWMAVVRTSPRPAGRKFRVTPVRETPGPA